MIFDFKKGFNDQPLYAKEERATIAISANVMGENSALHSAYAEAIIATGGVPMIIPHICNAASLRAMVNQVDGLLFSGGADFDARYFGQENIDGLTEYNTQRDHHEFMLLRIALDCAVPIFGICRGFQLFNIALGGDIYQDLASEYPTTPLNHSILTDKHLGVHQVKIIEGSQLHKILETNTISVNSRHHQALKNIANDLRAVAFSQDGVVEAVEGYPERKIIGVQWHPENMATQGESRPMQRLFEFFISEAQLLRTARKIHAANPIIDSHCDTPMLYDSESLDLSQRSAVAKVDIAKMEEGRLDATITVAYTPQSTPPHLATERAIDILKRFTKDIASHPSRVSLVRNPEELLSAKRAGKRAVMLGLENGLALGDSLENINIFKELGIQYITLCHNGSNAICDSAKGEKPHNGISEFGGKVIARMNQLGITVDISHSSEQATLQAVEISKQPIIASHSSCKALCDHPRNLSDQAIRAVAASGGVVQICGYGGFLATDRSATIHDIVAHIEHAASLVGYDHVGIGSDFDGDGGVAGFDGANEFISLSVELLRRGVTESDVAKVMGGNILRVLTNNLKVWC